MPYDRSRRERSRRRREGVELPRAVHERLQAVARDGIVPARAGSERR
jgi:hypothetical protein